MAADLSTFNIDTSIFTNNPRKRVSVTYQNALLRKIEDDIDAAQSAGGGTSAWGGITGDITAQLDLQNSFNLKQAAHARLDAITALDTNGILAKTNTNTYNARTITAGSAKISITNGNGVSGNPTVDLGSVALADLSDGATALTSSNGQPLDATLTALAAYNTNGILTQTAADTFTGRTITGTANEVTVSNGSGVAGNPTLSLPTPIKTHVVTLLVSDPAGSAITTGDGKAYWRVPSQLNGCDLVGVAASLSTVSSSGIPTVQIRNATQTADMLTTKLTIDQSELDSKDATNAAVIDTGNDDVATGDQLYIDIDVAGTGAKGLIVEMQFRLP